MIHWGAARLLWLLLLVPVLAALLAVGAWLKARALRRLADPELVPRLTDSRSARWTAIKVACVLLGLVFVIVAAARPQWGEKLQVVKGRGIDVVIALDASRSMLAADVPPSRLSRAKTQIASLLDNLSGNRVAIVAFAGSAQVLCPLTTDVEAAKLFLDIVDPDNMPKPGTNIQSAVETAASLFDPSDETSKALVLITDGDNLDGDPAQATRVAVQNHIRLFAVGVGTPQGATIPEPGAGTNYHKDESGKIVLSRLGERLLLVMAKATDGRYFRSESINLESLVGALDQIQKKAIAGGEYVEYEERYQMFLLAGFVLLFAGILISDRRGAWFPALATWLRARFRGSAGGAHAAVAVPRGARADAGPALPVVFAVFLLGAGVSPARADVGALMRRGLQFESEKKYDRAVKAFQDALVLEPDNDRIHYDLGRALFEAKQLPEAADQFQLGALTRKPPLRGRTLYNLGNAQYRQNKLDEAIAAYTLALLQNPHDLAAKQNLEFALKEKSQRKPQPDSTQQQPKQQPRPQQQQPQQQQPKPSPQAAQQQKGAIGKDQADRMLQALANKERDNLKKQPKPPEPPPKPGGKDW